MYMVDQIEWSSFFYSLEKIAEAYFENRKVDAMQLFEQVKNNHLEIVKYLLVHNWKPAEEQLKEFFTEIEWMLHDKPVRSYDYYYDQIVCCGELLSTCIVAHYLEELKVKSKWLDVRDIFRTDNNFRDAGVDFPFTEGKINVNVKP